MICTHVMAANTSTFESDVALVVLLQLRVLVTAACPCYSCVSLLQLRVLVTAACPCYRTRIQASCLLASCCTARFCLFVCLFVVVVVVLEGWVFGLFVCLFLHVRRLFPASKHRK